MRFKLIGLICLIMQCNLSCTQRIINKETVQTLDLHRYMGKWFEIARILCFYPILFMSLTFD